jgi:hypothetical protein
MVLDGQGRSACNVNISVNVNNGYDYFVSAVEVNPGHLGVVMVVSLL